MKEFCRKLCCCCGILTQQNFDDENSATKPFIQDSERSEKDDAKEVFSEEEMIIEEYTDINTPCFEDRLIRDEEKEMKLTKKSLKEIIDNEFISDVGYQTVYTKDNMNLSVKGDGGLFTKDFAIVRMSYFLPKSDFPPNFKVRDLTYYINHPDKRMEWDKGINSQRMVEGHMGKGIFYICLKKPIMIISERDSIEKKIWFSDNNGVLYSFSSSVNDEIFPPVENVERIKDYFSCYIISSDENNFYIKSLSQLDFKMNVPQFIINMTLPMKLKDWYRALKAFIHKEYESKNPKMQEDIPITIRANIENKPIEEPKLIIQSQEPIPVNINNHPIEEPQLITQSQEPIQKDNEEIVEVKPESQPEEEEEPKII